MMSEAPIHALLDCNSFFASCEKLFRPDLAHKPVVVLSNNDGCVVARSPEAKKLGVPMGEPYFKIKGLCEHGRVNVFSSNFRLYGNLSSRVMRLLLRWTPFVEIYSIDEAFLDLGGLGLSETEIDPLLAEIAATVKKCVGIPVSLGLGPTKTLAKVANDLAKRGAGICNLTDPATRAEALRALEIGDVWGIGRRLAPKMRKLGIRSAADLAAVDPDWIRSHFSVVLERLVCELRGENRLEIDSVPSAKKSIQVSRSFREATDDFPTLAEAVATFAAKACEKSRAQETVAGGVYVHANTSRFNGQYVSEGRAEGFPVATADGPTVVRTALKLLREIWRPGPMYKKATVILLDLTDAGAVKSQGTLFPLDDVSPDRRERDERLMESMDRINERLGRGSVFLGAQGVAKNWRAASDHCSPAYVSDWNALPIAKAK